MKKILVTGANGQLGSEIRLLSPKSQDCDFVFTDSAELDITQEQLVLEYFEKNHFDFIINCAAYTAVDKAETDKANAILVNGTAAGNLAKASALTNASLIHVSTDFVFDGRSSEPIKEDAVCKPISVYGESKLMGESLIQSENTKAMIIRTSWLYSSFGNNFVKTIIRLCKERNELNMIFDQVGTPTYARDLADTILSIISGNKFVPGIFHYSNEGVASWYDFAIAIRDLAGLKTKINPIETHQYPTPASRPKYSVLNKTKIKDTFALEIPYWKDSLQECMHLLQ